MKPVLASLAIALALALSAPARAQTTPTPAQQQELEAARADLQQAARRYSELSEKYGGRAEMRLSSQLQRKPVIGVVLAPDDVAGVRIGAITPGSPAAAAGLKSGDRITHVDGRAIEGGDGKARVDALRERLSGLPEDRAVKLGYQREGKALAVSVTPRPDQRVFVIDTAAGGPGRMDGRFVLRHVDAGRGDGDGLAFEGIVLPPGISPDIRQEILRFGSDCDGSDCKLPAMLEAVRWSGVNLAAVDAQLGRYFGTSSGVLVLSTGKELAGLQAGDVIQSIAGMTVSSPREAMDALRAQPADARVAVAYLRDRTPGTVQVAVPRPAPLPRATPVPPAMPGKDSRRRVVMVDRDGQARSWEGDASDTAPDWVQGLPVDGQVQAPRIMILGRDGKAASPAPEAKPAVRPGD